LNSLKPALFIALTLVGLSSGTAVLAQPDLVNVSAPVPSIDGRGTAIGGYDAVAYLDYGEATQGSPEIYFDYQNTFRFRFASKVTMKRFMGDPERFIPAFGGYCALSLGLAPDEMPDRKPGLYRAEPTFYKIIQDRVYLFSSSEALERWNQDEDGYRSRAEENWNAILESRRQRQQ
jgi:hypothetical protein